MPPTKPDKTLADYVAIAISPALIMFMVGAFVFYLLEIAYAGEHAGRLRWTMFWFVLASVLISRISIEQGSEYAAVYGVGLGLATALLLDQLVGFLPAAWVLLALIWWATSKLTWDCTLIDDDEDASGEGLLQVAGLDERAGLTTAAPSLLSSTPEIALLVGKSSEARVSLTGARLDISGAAVGTAALRSAAAGSRGEISRGGTTGASGRKTSKRHARPVGRWERLFLNRPERADQPHAPGLWVVYFSLAALPVFGIGQLLIARDDKAARVYGFVLLAIYVAAALGLLLTSSFLGLRRYLRQRYLQMPPPMARTWLGLGASLGAAVLFFCLLLPRPEADYSLTALVDKIGSPPQPASAQAMSASKAGEGQGRRLGNGSRGSSHGQDALEPGKSHSAPSAADATEPQARRKTGATQTPRPFEATPPSPRAGQGLATLFKWLVYGLLAAILLRSLWKQGPQLLAALKAIFRDLLSFLKRLCGGSRQAKPTRGAAPQAPRGAPHRPFALFQDPFVTGAARRMSPATLVCYSFQALEAWAEERQLERLPQQTPREFSRALGDRFTELAGEAGELTRLYSRLAYDNQPPDSACLVTLERLWRKLNWAG